MLERDSHLLSLRRAVDVPGSAGCVVLVSGEAGAGKSTLVRHFIDECGSRTVTWVGLCDPLRRGRRLAPLCCDIAPQVGDVVSLLAAQRRDSAMFTALLGALSRSPRRYVLAFEDLHWADDGTLDLVVFLGRRVAHLPLVLVLTYRDDELGPLHPLYHALAQLPSEHVTSVSLPPLSIGAVTELVQHAGLNTRRVFELSGGNPLLTVELVATGTLDVPPRIHALTCARLAALSADGRDVARLVATRPEGLEPWLLNEAVEAPRGVLDDCLSSGLLVLREGRVVFRHELFRLAVREVSGPVAILDTNRRISRVLADRAGSSVGSGPRVRRAVATDAKHAVGLEAAEDLVSQAVHYTAFRDRARAADMIERALALAAGHGMRRRLRAVRSLTRLYHGEWADAQADAGAVAVHDTGTHDAAGVMAACVLRQIRARRGLAPGDTAGQLSVSLERGYELCDEVVVVVAGAEQSWWRDLTVPDTATLRRAFDAAWSVRHPWHAGELAWWLHRSGWAPPMADWYAEPYRLMLQRKWQQAARAWAELGCPFEEAEALGASGDVRASRRALQLYDDLGATAAATKLRLRLADHQYAVTAGPGALTGRQLEVLSHLVGGASNADIAAALGISVRTVDHHVAAVLMKLSVSSRRDAKAAANRMGIGIGIGIGNSLVGDPAN